MRDALGGTVTTVIIVVFIVFSLGYLAFNVNYMKAFRMKDKIISLYEDFNGTCITDDRCMGAISDYATEIGYSLDNNLNCPKKNGMSFKAVENLFCVASIDIASNDDIKVKGDTKPKNYYRIVTKINIHIPVISNIIDFRFFYISGDTKAFIRNGG